MTAPPLLMIAEGRRPRAGESLSDDQENFKFWSIRHGVPFVVAYAIDDILAAFVAWRCLRDDALVAGGAT
jgi:hypothetical protein